ncbi:hypothetical protein AAHE18_11G119000 [Arachis hypogaea]
MYIIIIRCSCIVYCISIRYQRMAARTQIEISQCMSVACHIWVARLFVFVIQKRLDVVIGCTLCHLHSSLTRINWWWVLFLSFPFFSFLLTLGYVGLLEWIREIFFCASLA